jgi:HPr kinase/phosphorylase
LSNKSQINLYASAVSIADKGLLILGSSGSGKSELALAMLAHGAKLISDDQVLLTNGPNGITLSAPKPIIGKIEARFIGILNVPSTTAQLSLVIDLDKDPAERLPKKKFIEYFGKRIQLLNGKNIKGLEYSLIQLLKH